MSTPLAPFRAEKLVPNTPTLTKVAATLPPEEFRTQLRAMVGDDAHGKTVTAVENALRALLDVGSVGLMALASALASMQGLLLKNAQRRLEDLLHNARFDPWSWAEHWVPYVLAQRSEVLLAMDWTDYDADAHSTICVSVITEHGRATPLLWKTHPKRLLTDGGRTDEEDALLLRLRAVVPAGVRITLVADRGFADQKLMRLLTEWGWSYVIRLRKNITVTDAHGTAKPAGEWLRPDGRAVRVERATLTTEHTPIGSFVAVRAKDMKDAWLLACSADVFSSAMAVAIYGKRFTIEETFRDQKDPRFGMGLEQVRCEAPEKRDRLTMLAALAHGLLTLLGAAGEASGVDRTLSRKKGRVFSLLRQGQLYYELVPTMPEPYRTRLVEAFGRLIQQHRALAEPLGLL